MEDHDRDRGGVLRLGGEQEHARERSDEYLPTCLRCVQRQKGSKGRYMWMCHGGYAVGGEGYVTVLPTMLSVRKEDVLMWLLLADARFSSGPTLTTTAIRPGRLRRGSMRQGRRGRRVRVKMDGFIYLKENKRIEKDSVVCLL